MKIFLTGVAGFIGSHLLSRCLNEGHSVIGIDNFLTGKQENIDEVLCEQPQNAGNFTLFREDIRDRSTMTALAKGADVIIHEAAIGSVPWSIRDPMLAHETNLTGFLNILEAAQNNGIRRVVYASSSAVFGNAPGIPAVEGNEGDALSPYAASKHAQEIYAQAYANCYGLEIIGLRYFNVFGKRQDPNGPYAAVIPKWLDRIRENKPCIIYGNGTATRDYCHVSNIVQANFLAMNASMPQNNGCALALNIGCGTQTSLLELHRAMADAYTSKFNIPVLPPNFEPERLGDIEHSVADISLAQKLIGFHPSISVADGLHLLIHSL